VPSCVCLGSGLVGDVVGLVFVPLASRLPLESRGEPQHYGGVWRGRGSCMRVGGGKNLSIILLCSFQPVVSDRQGQLLCVFLLPHSHCATPPHPALALCNSAHLRTTLRRAAPTPH
jgi:hypothetical protein